jgi:hypothetical protein
VVAIIALAVPVYADDAVLVFVNGAINPAVPAGSVVTINNAFVGIASGENVVIWLAVGTPGGAVYLFEPGPGNYIDFHGGASGGSITCNVPFGGSGSLSTSGASGTATVDHCSGTNPLWSLSATTETPSDIETACDGGHTPAVTGSPTSGDTSTMGLYAVVACYYNGIPIVGSFKTPGQLFSVPEFGSLAAALTLGLVALVFVRRRVVDTGLTTR